MSVTLIQVTGQGPMGPQGLIGPKGDTGDQGIAGITTILYEDAMPLANRTDVVSDNLIYVGEAQPGTLNSAAAWRIKRMTISNDGDVDIQWADGNAEFDNVWNDRLTLGYV